MDIEQHVTGNFYLTAPDVDEQLDLTYQGPNDPKDGFAGVIEPTVFAVGYNRDYIIAKQHKKGRSINYFIVPINPPKKVRDNYFGLIGPLTSDEFDTKRKELNLEKVQFTIVYKNLE